MIHNFAANLGGGAFFEIRGLTIALCGLIGVATSQRFLAAQQPYPPTPFHPPAQTQPLESAEPGDSSRSFEGEPGLVVLKHGGTLWGRVARLSNKVQVTQGLEGAVLLVPVESVDAIARDLDDAYAQLARKANPAVVGDQTRLANWLIGQQMLADAARHLLLAQAIDAQDPRVHAAQRRLRVAIHSAGPAEQNAPTRTAGHGTATNAKRPESCEAGNAFAEPRERTHSLDCPLPLVEGYVRNVQPVLLNRCAAGGCHGDDDAPMPLKGPTGGVRRPLTRLESLSNLEQVLTQVAAGTEDSPLVRLAQTSHGGSRRPPLSRLDAAARQALANWVAAVQRANGRHAATNVPASAPQVQSATWTTAEDIPPANGPAPRGNPYDPADFNKNNGDEKFEADPD